MPNLLGIDSTYGIIEDIKSKVKGNDNLASVQNTPLNNTSSKSTLDSLIDKKTQYNNSRIGGYSDVSKYDEFVKLNSGNYLNPYEGEDYYVGTDNNERLAQQQTTTEKWGNGLAKLGINTATATIGGTIGILDSLGTLMTTGSLSEAYNSGLNKTLDDINTYVGYKLPNLYTQQDRDASLFGQMGQANFYADKVFGGLSFMAGAVVSEAIWSAATVATFGGTAEILALNTAKQAAKASAWATKAFGTEAKLQTVVQTAKAWAKTPSTSLLDEAGNVAMRGLTNGEKQSTILAYKFGKGFDIMIPMVRSAGYESGMEARLYMNQTETAWLDKYRETNGAEPSSEEYTNFKDKLTDSANLVFGANMAILSVSNYAQLKNTILGRTTDRTITNNAWSKSLFGKGFTKNLEDGTLEAIKATKAQKIFGKVYGLGRGFVIEGQEEMSQGISAATGENYMMAEFDKDKIKSSYGLAESFNDALKHTYGTKEGLTEGLIGGLIGVLGGSASGINNLRKGRNFNEIDNERDDISKAVEYSNEYTAKTLVNNLTASNKMMLAQNQKDTATRNNDISGEKLAEANMSMLRIQRDFQIGGIEEGLKDFEREVKALDTEYLKEELGFTTLEEVNNYKEKVILDHNEIAKNYQTNLAYAESLLGEKDSKIEEFKNIPIRTIHAAMAQDLTMGEIARKNDNNLTGTINDEILKLSGVEGLVEANNVQQVLDSIPESRKTELKVLRNIGKNLNERLATQQANLISQGKVKTGEDASIRQNKLIELSQEIEQTQREIAINKEQSEIAVKGLGIEQYTDGIITVDSFDKQEANVAKFKTFMEDLSKTKPKEYSKMLALLAQKSKSTKHIKTYEQAVDLIVNKATRLKTVEGWAKKVNLKTDPATYYREIIGSFNDSTMVVTEDNTQKKENREAFGENEEIEKVSPQYIAKLKEQKYEGLLSIDQKILDAHNNKEGVGMEMPDRVAELEKEREEALSKVAPAIVVEEIPITETEEITPNTEEINKLEKERDIKIFQASKPDLKLKLISAKDLVNSKDPIGNKEIHDTIKEKLKNLKQLIECL